MKIWFTKSTTQTYLVVNRIFDEILAMTAYTSEMDNAVFWDQTLFSCWKLEFCLLTHVWET